MESARWVNGEPPICKIGFMPVRFGSARPDFCCVVRVAEWLGTGL